MEKSFRFLLIILVIAIACIALINLNTGFLSLSFKDFFSETEQSSLAAMRMNRVAAMLLAGVSIPSSGFLLQEYFRNPLAGPSVLGITSVASLSVAFYIFVSQDFILPSFLQNSLLSISAIAGSLLLMLVLIVLSKRFQDGAFLIIFGFLVSALAGAVVSVMQLYAENQSLKNYVLWSFGANNQLSAQQLWVLAALVCIGLMVAFRSIRPLIGNALGEAYAQTIGVNLSSLKISVICASSILSASVTAFLGPVLFIGIVVPHFARMIYNPSHLWQQWLLNMLLGACIMLLFSCVSEWTQFPLNVITSLFGIPVILAMMLKSRKY